MSTSNVKIFLARKKRKRDVAVEHSIRQPEGTDTKENLKQKLQNEERKRQGKGDTDGSFKESHHEKEVPRRDRPKQTNDCVQSTSSCADETSNDAPRKGEVFFEGLQLSPLATPDYSNSSHQHSERDLEEDVRRLEQLLESKDLTIRHLSEDLQQTRTLLFETRNELQHARHQSHRLKCKAFDIHQKFLRWDKLLQDWVDRNKGKPTHKWDSRPGFFTDSTTSVNPNINTTFEQTYSHNRPHSKSAFPTGCHDRQQFFDTATSKTSPDDKLNQDQNHTSAEKQKSDRIAQKRTSNPPTPKPANIDDSGISETPLFEELGAPHSSCPEIAHKQSLLASQPPTGKVPEKQLDPSKRRLDRVYTPLDHAPAQKIASLNEESDDDGLLRDVRLLEARRRTRTKAKQARAHETPDQIASTMMVVVDKENCNPNIRNPRRVTMTPKSRIARSPMEQTSDSTDITPHWVRLQGSSPETLDPLRVSKLPVEQGTLTPKSSPPEEPNQSYDKCSNSPPWNEFGSSEALLSIHTLDRLPQSNHSTSLKQFATTQRKEQSSAKPSVAQEKSLTGSATDSVVAAVGGWRSNVMARTFIDEALGPQQSPRKIANSLNGYVAKENLPKTLDAGSATKPDPKSSGRNDLLSSTWMNTAKGTTKTVANDHDDSQINYKYVEVVRGKKKRECLPGHSCPDCDPFWAAVCDDNDVFDRKQFQDCSRHRATHTPESTPPNFWELSFRDEILARQDSGSSDSTTYASK